MISTSHVISELQIKTNYDYRPTIVKIQNIDSAKCCQRNFYSLLVEKQKNGTATFEDNLAGILFCFVLFYKTKHTLTIRSSNCAP